MRKIFFMFISMLLLFNTTLHAEVPTRENVTKLYVATFNRAPDSAGLAYWLNDSGLQLEEIAKSFFDQPETKEKYYPEGTITLGDFVNEVYANLFNRVPDSEGFDYWVDELYTGSVHVSTFILAVINGAQDTEEFGNDATILENKTIVGLAFADAGLDDVELATEIMSGITDDYATVLTALESLAITEPLQDYLDAVNNARAVQQDCGEYGIMPAVGPLVWNHNLYAAAKEHSNDMAKSNTFSHDGSGTEFDITAQALNLDRGSTVSERIDYNGYIWSRYGENIAAGYDTAPEVVQAWIDSDGHCRNLMNSEFKELGMSMIEDATSDYIYYWTQNFGTPR